MAAVQTVSISASVRRLICEVFVYASHFPSFFLYVSVSISFTLKQITASLITFVYILHS